MFCKQHTKVCVFIIIVAILPNERNKHRVQFYVCVCGRLKSTILFVSLLCFIQVCTK